MKDKCHVDHSESFFVLISNNTMTERKVEMFNETNFSLSVLRLNSHKTQQSDINLQLVEGQTPTVLV